MTERYFISKVSPDPRNPATSLARIVFRREQGVTIQEGVMETDPTNAEDIRDKWDRITTTLDFHCLERAFNGDTEYFRETMISSANLVFPNNYRRFMTFYNFLRSLAYEQAIEQAQLQENHFLARDLKLESRRNWTPGFKWYQRRFVPGYMESILTRVYNLVTTGEEKPTMQDRALDFIMG